MIWGNILCFRMIASNAVGKWEPSQLEPGQAFNSPQPLFKKLDIKIVEEERARLG